MGPRGGATEWEGSPYWYRSVYLDGEWDPDEDRFELTPLTKDALAWELERSAIFSIWDAARRSGAIEWKEGDLGSFGAMPSDRARYADLNRRMEQYLEQTRPALIARAAFEPGSKVVRWQILGTVPSGA